MPEAGFTKADLYRSGPRVNASRRCDGCQRPGLRGRTSTALGRALMLADGAMDARGRVYEDGPPPLWAAR